MNYKREYGGITTTAWEVYLTDRTTIRVYVPDHLPEHVAARSAMDQADRALSKMSGVNPRAFSARPRGCAGLSATSHSFHYCPIHSQEGDETS